jgi:hypothetical protein
MILPFFYSPPSMALTLTAQLTTLFKNIPDVFVFFKYVLSFGL